MEQLGGDKTLGGLQIELTHMSADAATIEQLIAMVTGCVGRHVTPLPIPAAAQPGYLKQAVKLNRAGSSTSSNLWRVNGEQVGTGKLARHWRVPSLMCMHSGTTSVRRY